MRIICPTCASHYEVDRDQIGAEGQLVRCAECREVWLVRAGADPRPEAPAIEAAPGGRPDRDVNAFAAAVRAQTVPQPEGLIDFQAAKTRLRRRSQGGGGSRTGTASLLAIGAVAATTLSLMVGFRSAVVTRLPVMAGAYAAIGLASNDQGLALRGVHSVMVAEGGKTVLNLEGEIANLRDGPTAVPNLTVVVRDDAETPLYTWTAPAPKTRLAKGETIAFRSRLAAPPTDGHDVRVSFADAGPVLPTRR